MATTTRVLDANVNGTVYTSNANSALEALDTCHSGATAPTNEVANGKLWLDTTTTPGILKIYNNATWEVVHSGTVDINAGTIDGTTIGATTPAAVTGTTLTATGAFTSLGIDDNAASTAVTIDSGGYVGVNYTNPSNIGGTLSVVQKVSGKGIAIGDATVSDSLFLENNTSQCDIKNNSTKPIVFSTNSTERMRIDSSGNVGIGTDAPDGRLHVAGSGVEVFLENSDTTANGSHEFKMTALKQGIGFNVLTLGGWEHRFNVGGAQGQAAKIDSSGIFYVGKGTTAFGAIGSYISSGGAVGFTAATTPLSLNRVAGTTGEIASFWYNTSQKGSITVTASATAYNTSSDYRLKENITPVQGAVDIVKAMQPVTYTFKSDGSWHDGFLAHELQELHPRAVVGEKDAMKDEEYEVTPAVLDEDGVVVTEAVMGTRSVPDYQQVDYSKITPILTAALQEALNKIDALEVRIAALEA